MRPKGAEIESAGWKREFEISEINPNIETVWLRFDSDRDGSKSTQKVEFDVSVEYVNPDDPITEKILALDDYDYVTCTLDFYRTGPDNIGWWEFREIHSMRESEGTERSIYS